MTGPQHRLFNDVIVAALLAQRAASRGELFASEAGLAFWKAVARLAEDEPLDRIIANIEHELDSRRSEAELRHCYRPVERIDA